jgi:hypothetical protein
MSVLLSDIKCYAAAVNPEDDSTTAIGGAIDLTKKFDFTDWTGNSKGVSDNAGDTTQTLTLTYRDASGAIQTTTIALNGTAEVTNATSIARALKAHKSAGCAGSVALVSQTADHSGTLASLGTSADEAVLDGGASAVDGHYNGMVFKATGGTGSGKLVEVINYVGASKTATFSKSVAALFDATTTFSIYKGFFFDKTPSEILDIVRMDYNSAADVAGGSERDFYQKLFFKHTDASSSGLNLTSCKIVLTSNPSTRVKTSIESTLNGSGTNGIGNNRQIAPSAGVGTFDTSDKTVPSGAVLTPGDKIGLWMELVDAAGAPALNTTWTPGFQGQTI